MNAGQLNKRITLQYISGTVLQDGLEVANWVNGATVWAKAEPLKGRELWIAQSIHPEINMRFTIRYIRGITSEMRIVYNNTNYEIINIIDKDEKHKELELTCKVVV